MQTILNVNQMLNVNGETKEIKQMLQPTENATNLFEIVSVKIENRFLFRSRFLLLNIFARNKEFELIWRLLEINKQWTGSKSILSRACRLKSLANLQHLCGSAIGGFIAQVYNCVFAISNEPFDLSLSLYLPCSFTCTISFSPAL